MAIERYILELQFVGGARWHAEFPRCDNGIASAQEHEWIAMDTFRKWGEMAEDFGTPKLLTLHYSPGMQCIRSFDWEPEEV